MTDEQRDQTSTSAVKQAIVEIRTLRARLEECERRTFEPLAVVGIGCRYPGGVDGPDAFWRLLHDGVDAVSEIPSDRWDVEKFYDVDPDAPGKMSTRWGGFVDNVDTFDPDFFGISPREAVSLDPQQRLLLEVSWEALEHAGLAPDRQFGSRTGVFVGIGSFDYSQLQLQPGAIDRIDAYLATGVAHSAASGRLSYVFGFRGPSISIDTACSSSLVSIHLAAQSLRAGECDMALAGGVNLILTPEVLINLSKARMMAPDGRCKAFDAAADGFVRSEGCGMVVLRRLSDAVADGNRVLAVIRGTAVNQDGRSSGLTAPNGPSQQAVIRNALANARLEPAHVDYVEAHGTGTSLGDPIELQALASVLGEGRRADRPLKIGSVKTNLGHCEAAAGVAGLIKVVLAMQQNEIPPHLHLREPSPHIAWSAMNVTVPVEPTPWGPGGSPRIAGVSSFGFSGTNAHVILEEAPPRPSSAAPAFERPRHILALSARSDAALRQLADRMAASLASRGGEGLADVAYTANAGRSHLACRVALTAGTAEEARQALEAFGAGSMPTGARAGRFDAPAPPEPVFLFTGQGSQYAGMGRELFETQPVFRRAIERCAAALRDRMDPSLTSVLFDAGRVELLNRTEFTQPALFALQYALAALWQSWGIEPIAVMGHSIGEYAAAAVAGVFSVEDGLMLAAERGRLMQSSCAPGAMAAVFADERRVAEHLRGLAVVPAALNGDANTVIAGDRESVAAAVARFEAAGIRCKPLGVSHGFHSPLMDPMLDEFERAARRIAYSEPTLPLVSNLTGAPFAPGEKPDAVYWRRHAREAVKFAAGVRTLYAKGHRCFLEIGPGHTLLGMARQAVPDEESTWLPSLRHGQADWVQILDSLAALYVAGARVDWSGFDKEYRRTRVTLPTYPFQRKRYWAGGEDRQSPPDPARPWREAVAAGTRQASQVPMDLQLQTYPAKWACLDRLVPALMTRALRDVGAFARAGDVHAPADLVERFGIQPTYHHLMARWMKRLEGEGLLTRCADGWRADVPLPDPPVDALAADARQQLADIPFLYDYLMRCGELLSAVLTGKESPLETLFPGGSPDTAMSLYHRWALSRYYNGISRAAVEALVRGSDPSRKIRVLEVGAGTGGTTAALLPVLPPDRTTYFYTDLSEFFFDQATRQFSSYPFLRCRKLNIEQPPQDQGFGRHDFDLVVAANVLHATRDLRDTLDHVISLLRPGGMLLLYEVTDPPSWGDVSIALIEGWQRFDDGLRGDGPLLPLAQWRDLLASRGFEDVIALPEPGSPAEILASHVMLARAKDTGAVRVEQSPDELAGEAERPVMTASASQQDGAEALTRRIEEALPEEREEILTDYVRECVAQVLRRDASSPIGRHDRLMDLGVDSLMAVELRNLLGTGVRLPARLPATLMFDYPTVAAIARYLGELIAPAAPAPQRIERAAIVPSAASRFDELSDAEVEALLIEKLDRM